MTSADDRSTSNVYLPLLLSVTVMVPQLGVQGTPMLSLLTKNTVALTGCGAEYDAERRGAGEKRQGFEFQHNGTLPLFWHKNDGATLGPARSPL